MTEFQLTETSAFQQTACVGAVWMDLIHHIRRDKCLI